MASKRSHLKVKSMRRVQLSVYVDGDLADDLDGQARIAGMSRSAFIEKLLVEVQAGGNKRSRRHAAYVATGIRELLRHAGGDIADRARKEYDRVIEREGLKDDEIMEDQRRVARK